MSDKLQTVILDITKTESVATATKSGAVERRATPRPRSGAAAERSNPMSEERRLSGHRMAERSYSTFKVRRGNLVQGKEQWLRYALLCWSSREEIPHVQGERKPTKMVGVVRGHQRADTLKPQSQKTSQSNHTRITALSNSMKLSHALWGHPRRAGHGGEM